MQIKNAHALVTGGGSGLGAATARRLAVAGARVAILDFDGARARAVAAEIGGNAIQVDVGDADAVGASVDSAVEIWGSPPQIAVNCAGIGSAARIVGREGKLSCDLFEKTLRVNLMGTFYVMSHAARHMANANPDANGERGVIVNTASVAFEDGQVGQAAYAASKGGIVAMSLPAAREFARVGVRVAAIAPGLFKTPMMESLPDEVADQITSNIPFPARLGDPEEFALMATQIIENPYLNGTTVRLDAAVRLPRK